MIVKIEPPSADCPHTGDFTKVSTVDGQLIHGIRSAEVRLAVHEPITAKIECFAGLGDVTAEGTIFAVHPISGLLKEVRHVEFADGSCWPPFREG